MRILTLTPLPALQAVAIAVLLAGALLGRSASAQSIDLGDGFIDHGPFADVTVSRGMVSTMDGDGNDVVLILLRAAGLAEMGIIDARTGAVEQIPFPERQDWPFASILSERGRYYTYTGGFFMEFDPLERRFSFAAEGPRRAAMSMTEDDNGLIWAALYPEAHVVSYNPDTSEFRTYGPISDHPSLLYPRSIAADDQGWIYVHIGGSIGQLFMLDPHSGEVRTVIPEEEVTAGSARVYRDTSGMVYGFAPKGGHEKVWFELYGGQASMLDSAPRINHKHIVAGGQGLAHCDLPGGERITGFDLVNGRMLIEDPRTGQTRQVDFEIGGGGSSPMQLAVAQNGTIAGGTYHPKRFFSYDPRTDEWTRRECYGQWNAVVTTEDRFYVASYTEGVLLEWDPTREWVATERGNPDSNPRYLEQTLGQPHVGRPYAMLAHPDGRHIVYGGTPHYHHTGGGLVVYDIQTEAAEIITHEQLVPWHSQASLVALPDGRILGGTSVEPAMGGVRKAEVAELYILDMQSRQVEWHGAPVEGAERFNDLIVGPDGNVYGIVDRTRLFVFDPVQREIVHIDSTPDELGPSVHQQAPRIFIKVPDGRIFALFTSGIAQLDTDTHRLDMVATAPRSLGNGGAYFEGRLYFAGGLNLFSWELPPID